MNRRGPSTEPWGTPWDRWAKEEVQLLILQYWLREDSRWEMRIAWLIVSKAAVRSRRMRIERWPESEERRRSLVTLRRAVSVLNIYMTYWKAVQFPEQWNRGLCICPNNITISQIGINNIKLINLKHLQNFVIYNSCPQHHILPRHTQTHKVKTIPAVATFLWLVKTTVYLNYKYI